MSALPPFTPMDALPLRPNGRSFDETKPKGKQTSARSAMPSFTGSANASRPRMGKSRLAIFSSPVLAGHYSPWRYRVVWLMLCAGFMLVMARAIWVQALHPDFLLDKAEERMVKDIAEPAPRGRILDRHGNILASSIQVASLYVSPRAYREGLEQKRKRNALRKPIEEQQQVAKLLGLDADDVQEKFVPEDKGFKGDYLLKRQIPWELSEQVMALKLPGVYRNKEYQRQYPGGEAVAQLVGLTDTDGKGLDGLELAFNEKLSGATGRKRVLRDPLGRTIETVDEESKAKAGGDVKLAIDSHIQFHAYRLISETVQAQGAKAGSVVVADALTGEVLGLANYPSFDPSKRGNNNREAFRNRALTDSFEPGSTMKPFTAALALDSKRVTPNSLINTSPGRMQMAGFTISDHSNNGTLSVAQIVQKSSNIGTAKLAMQMQPQEMWDMFTHIGLGQRPQLEVQGAVSGKLRPYKNWRPVEQVTMSYGYGLSASLIQLARAYTVFARDGELIPLTLMAHDSPAPVAGTRVMSEQTAKEVRKMLQAAAGPGGTAPKAQTIGYSVGGKTGTARKLEGRTYSEHKYRSFFVGVAPVYQPRLVIAVMVDEPAKGKYYGGDIAAPVFSEVMQNSLRILGIAPDLPVKPDVNVQAVEESI
jgi:cell division protein FtsI (penicillin-binding protein 3)